MPRRIRAFPRTSGLAIGLGVAAFLAGSPVGLRAQTPPFGDEFQVNTTYSAYGGDYPSIAPFGNSFVAVWDGYRSEANEHDVFCRRFASAFGVSVEFPVNTYTPHYQWKASVASSGGTFVVVWESDSQDGYRAGVFGQRYQNGISGGIAPLGAEFPVNTHTGGFQSRPQVGADAAGDFVVVWSGAGDGDDAGVFGQRFDSSGAKVQGEFRINTYTTGGQSAASLAVAPAGGFVVVWANTPDMTTYEIRGQVFDGSGTRIGPEFLVSSDTSELKFDPRVASDRLGNFVVVWAQDKVDGSSFGVFGQRFNSAGEKAGGTFQVNTYTTGGQSVESVAADPSGNFVVAWSGPEGTAYGILGQRFDRNGRKLGSEFQVNAFTTENAFMGVVMKDAFGVTAAFHGLNNQIWARRQAFTAGPMNVDRHDGTGTVSDRNGVLEPGEAALVEPSWHRPGFGLGTVPLTGTAAELTGPSGPLYLLYQTSADYGGAVGLGATPNCYDATPSHACYVASVIGARPALHWDATFTESLSTGGGEPRILHIGDSFSDVPRTEPFYAKIETLLHSGIATGCGGTKYCPGDVVSRGQMATFVARGIAGSGDEVPTTGRLFGTSYSCKPAGTSLFTDVSASDPICKHVHYVGAENVTLGCGVGKYCPAEPVTRDAMASFIAKTIVAPAGAAEIPATYGPDPNTGRSYSCDTGSPNLHFTDIAASNPFCKHIHFLWAKGIVDGCTATTYCPGLAVTRDAMAKFLVNAFGLALYGP